jgi:hypothetical protein
MNCDMHLVFWGGLSGTVDESSIGSSYIAGVTAVSVSISREVFVCFLFIFVLFSLHAGLF